jgi:hypothetical protein
VISVTQHPQILSPAGSHQHLLRFGAAVATLFPLPLTLSPHARPFYATRHNVATHVTSQHDPTPHQARSDRHIPSTLAAATLVLTAADLALIEASRTGATGPHGPFYGLERDRTGKHGAVMRYNLNRYSAPVALFPKRLYPVRFVLFTVPPPSISATRLQLDPNLVPA